MKNKTFIDFVFICPYCKESKGINEYIKSKEGFICKRCKSELLSVAIYKEDV